MPTKTKPSKPKKSLFRKAVKYVYFFGSGKADGNGKMKALLGGKGANLAEMTRIRLPVPAGFTISTDVCTYFYENQNTYPPSLERQIDEAIAKIEHSMGKKLGDPINPLLLAVRSEIGRASCRERVLDHV